MDCFIIIVTFNCNYKDTVMVRTNRTATCNQIVARSMGHNNFVNVEFKSEHDGFTAIVF